MTFKDYYITELAPKLKEDLRLSNVMSVPRVVKITVNVGDKSALTDKKVLDIIASQLGEITGQKAVITKARKSIATFKLRQGDPIGVMVTLRGQKMYDFLQKLIAVVLPRVKDFRGVSLRAFDGQGNYSLGITEQIVFPEIDHGKIDRVRSLQVVITTSARNDEECRALLSAFGMPFEKNK
jgi:large subunit ribosomal protein L5